MKNESVLLSNLGFVIIITAHACAFHIDSTTLADGTYELVTESKSEQCEAQVNLTEAAQDPNQSLEEPRADNAQEGKPRSMTYLFVIYAIYCSYLLVHLKLKGVVWNLSCMIIGTYV